MENHNGEYSVYVHINILNGKMYFGNTKNIKNRWYPSGYRTSTKFYRAIKKYGWNNFSHEIIASNLTKQEADKFEDILIKRFRTNEDEFGYNTTVGGQSWSGEENPNFGKHTLREIYKSNKQLSKEKQSRPGKQNGRAIPCELYLNGKFVDSFEYQSLAAKYVREELNYHSKVADCVLVSRMKRDCGFKGYKIITVEK